MLSAPPPTMAAKRAAPPPGEWVPRIVDLPTLEKDPFGWTPKELEDAARTARRWRAHPRKPQKKGGS